MGKRLLLFLGFLTLTAILISFKSYQKYLSPQETFMSAMTKPKEAEKTEKEDEDIEEEKSDVLVINTPSLKNGLAVYTEKGQCITCHGEQGEGKVEEEAPLIAGQYSWYIADQIKQIKSGARVAEKMKPYLSTLSDEDIKNVAEYISKLRVKAKSE